MKPVYDPRQLASDSALLEPKTDFYSSIKSVIDKFTDRRDGEYVVFIQVGSFYELYYSQAEKYAQLLGLKSTHKETKEGSIPFSGFPDYALNKYLPIIFEKGLKTVVCKQVENPLTGNITRPVDRLITAGTVIDDSLRDYHRNNFLMSLSFPDDYLKNPEGKKIGVSWCDVNLGQFSYVETSYSELMATIIRIDPAEILISNKISLEELVSGRWFPEFVDLKNYYITQFGIPSSKKSFDQFLDKFQDTPRIITNSWDKFTVKEKSAAMQLLHYLDFCIPNHKPSFTLPIRDIPKTVMKIDTRASQDLELTHTIQNRHRVGTLLHIMDKTVTSPGARLLNTWLLAPSTQVEEIKSRQDLVGCFLKNMEFTQFLSTELKNTADVNRILKRIDNDNADIFEYLELANTIENLRNFAKDIKKRFKKDVDLIEKVTAVFSHFNKSRKLHCLAKDIIKTIDPSLSYRKSDFKIESQVVRQYWNVQPSATVELQKLHSEYETLVNSFNKFESSFSQILRERKYNGSIKFIRDLKTFNHVIELKSTSKVISTIVKELNFQVAEKSKSCTKLNHPEWSTLAPQMEQIERKIIVAEQEIMNSFKIKIQEIYKDMRKISPVIERLDVLQSFANLALEKNLVRPHIDNSKEFKVIDGRHLVVEHGLRLRMGTDFTDPYALGFTSNSCWLNNANVEDFKELTTDGPHSCPAQSYILTGPNMGGKSTYLRSLALIAILSQIGSFVPAESVHLGIIDSIFTRIGSNDNIYKNQSTFMIEMLEMGRILRESTDRSLVLLDEVGRGTSSKEGVAIGFAGLKKLICPKKGNGNKVLFATHFGPELIELIDNSPEMKKKIQFYKTSLEKVKDDGPIDERVKFNHKLQRGVCVYSHALEVAQLAGWPADAVEIAKDMLH